MTTIPRSNFLHPIAIVGLLLAACTLMTAVNAWALPVWSRKYEVRCTYCHSAWPTLNAEGREFKLRGFRLADEADDASLVTAVGEFLTFDRNFPLAGRLIMRPFDKTRDGTAHVRSFHEVELYLAGPIARDFSVFTEVEAEDEDEFNLFVEQGTFGWHPTLQANIALGWAPPFWADPFSTLADGGRRMTRAHKGPLDQRFAAGERLRSSSQWVGFYGQGGGRVFYNAGVSAGGDDPEGEDAKDVFGRLMVEVLPGVNLGGFTLNGTNEALGSALDFYRAGFDFQVEHGAFTGYGMVMHAKDDRLEGGTVGNTVGYLEGFYAFEPSWLPLVVPLVRVDFLDPVTNLTTDVNFYLRDNVKAYVEWWQNLDVPDGVRRDNRITVQVDVAL